jgi:mono/diheme cytochrome c family protein
MRFHEIASRAVLGAATILLLTVGAHAQEGGRRELGNAVQRGQASFRDTCAVCHGESGQGNGPAAKALRDRPIDLTRLKGPDGSFPAERVAKAISGTSMAVAHGTSEMPIWGPFFLADANGDQVKADARVADIVKYIEWIQRK